MLPGFRPVLNSVIRPAGVIRPIAPVSTNRTLPSGPTVSELGSLPAGSPVENSVIGAALAAADMAAVISSASISARTARISIRPQSTVPLERYWFGALIAMRVPPSRRSCWDGPGPW